MQLYWKTIRVEQGYVADLAEGNDKNWSGPLEFVILFVISGSQKW